MKNSKTSAYQAKRQARKRLRKVGHRCFGLECLEKRTVFANDLSPMLDEVASCFPLPVQESRATPSSERTVEVASSPVSLLQGDVIHVEVPEAILLQLTDRDTYELQVYYSENYFSYNAYSPFEIGDSLDAFANLHDAYKFQSSQPATSRSTTPRTSNEAPASSSAAGSSAAGAWAVDERSVGHSSIVLASLTATDHFEGMVRILDVVQDPSEQATNLAVAGLPNEVRIEPNVTVPTAMRDPGATLVRTIIVNRATHGLMVSEGDGQEEASTMDEPATAELAETPTVAKPAYVESTVAPKEVSSEQRPSRSVVTLKSIDISTARRTDSSRPWMRSSTIANPELMRESESKRSKVEATPTASIISAKSAAESSKPTRRELRVHGTQLQPVEFLLARSTGVEDQAKELETERILATDRVIGDYSGEEPSEYFENTGALWAMSTTWLQSSPSASKWSFEENDETVDQERNRETWVAPLANLRASPLHGDVALSGVALNKESWKNVLRTTSESTAGQAMLASLTTLAVQHREMNVFGTKTAWEFVTKSNRNSPV